MDSIEAEAERRDKMYIAAEASRKWRESFGFWVGGAEMLTVKPLPMDMSDPCGEWEVTSEQRCKDHGCGRICYSKTGHPVDVMDYCVRISRNQHPALVAQVKRNLARIPAAIKASKLTV